LEFKSNFKLIRKTNLKDLKKMVAANTDNKGHLFVTVFELPAFYIMTLKPHHPDTASVLTIKLFVT